MQNEPLARMAAVLAQMGATLLDSREVREGGQATTVLFHAFRGHVIRSSWNITDDLRISVSASPVSDPDAATWRPLFSVTVPGFDSFDAQQKLDWVLSVPDGPAADAFIASHVRKLSNLLPLA